MPFPKTHPALARALEERSYLEPTPVQAAVLDEKAIGRDLLVSAQTGSGKTVAFGLALRRRCSATPERFAPRRRAAGTRRRADTRTRAAGAPRTEWLYAPAGAPRRRPASAAWTCGASAGARSEGAHIVVGTPGPPARPHRARPPRHVANARRGARRSRRDARPRLSRGPRIHPRRDAGRAPHAAVLGHDARDIATLAKRYQRDAVRIERRRGPASCRHRISRGPRAPNDVEHAIVNVLRYYECRAPGVLRRRVTPSASCTRTCYERGFSAVALSGELSQNERTHALQSLRDGRASVCVATDVAARGIDLPDLDLVIHADLPQRPPRCCFIAAAAPARRRQGHLRAARAVTRRRKAERADRMPASRRVDGPPSAEEIRTRDQERLVRRSPARRNIVRGGSVLAARSSPSGRRRKSPPRWSACTAAAYRRRKTSWTPGPRDTRDTRETRDTRNPKAKREEWSPVGDQAPRPPSDNRRPTGPMTWFRMSVGRRNNADPRWLLPMICRLGHVTKKEIGAIKIADRETKFEVVQEAAARFAAAVLATAQEDIRIQPDDGGPEQGRPAPQKKAPRSDRPFTPRQTAPSHNEANDQPRKKPFREKREGEMTGPDRSQNRVPDQSFRGEGPKVIKPRRPAIHTARRPCPAARSAAPALINSISQHRCVHMVSD